MAERDEADLRKQLQETTDPGLVRQRDQLETGEPQPQLEVVANEEVLRDLIEVAVGESVEVPVKVDIASLIQAAEKEARAMLVIRERGITDNRIRVVLDLGVAGAFGDPRENPEGPRLADIHFFDHVNSDEHRPGMVMASEEPLGHWFIDAGPVLAWLQETEATEKELALRIAVLQLHAAEEPKVGFIVGGISLSLVAGIR